MPEIPWAIASDRAADALPWSAQRLVNLYARRQEVGGKTQHVLLSTPGLTSPWATLATSPFRGAKQMADHLYAVGGNTLYKITTAGSTTALGAGITGSGPVEMAANRTQVCVVDPETGAGWVGTETNLTKITDADYQPAASVRMLNARGIFAGKDTQRIRTTALDDFASLAALEFAEAEYLPDDLVGVEIDHSEAWLFGKETIEVWQDVGGLDFALQRIPGGTIERGCLARASIAKEDNTLFWLGDDGIVYRVNGYTPQRVSTHAIESAIRRYVMPENAEGFIVNVDGHKFYHLTFPDGDNATGTGSVTHVYDIAQNLWHDREDFDPVTGIRSRWKGRDAIYFAGKTLVGDRESGAICEYDPRTWTDNGETLRREATGVYFGDGDVRLFAHRLFLDFETGVGLTSGQGSDPQVMLQWSDDGGRIWSNEVWVGAGEIGDYLHRAVWHRLGTFRSRVFRFAVADPVKVTMMGAHGDWTVGAT